MNKRIIYSVTTMLIMIIASRFLNRIVDATVQIDDDIGYLVILLIPLNTAIGRVVTTCTEKYHRT